MAVYNLGTARGAIQIDTNDLKNADIALRSAGTSMVGFGAAALGAFGYVIGVGAQFEKEMSFVAAVTGASKEELDKLSNAAIELGKKGPFGPREVAAGFVDLAKAGLSAQEIVDGVGEAAVNLAAAGDIPFTEAAETLVNVMRTFNIEAKDVAATVDSIAGAANASTVDISDMATSLKYAGAPAAALGLDIQELNAAIGILGNRGIRGSTAGTSLRRIFLQLASPTQAASDRMKELGLITEDGANAFFTAEGKAKDLAEIFQILQTATAGLTDKEKIAALNDIFGARAVNSALILMEQGAEGFQAFTDQMSNTSAAEVAEKRMDNLAGAVQRLKAALEATFISAGSPFQDFLKNLVNILRDVVLWFGKLPRGLQTFILGGIAVVGVLSLMSGIFLLTIGNMVRAVRVIGELGHAARVLAPALRAVAIGARAVSVAFLTNPIVLIIAAVIALGVAFYMLYRRSEAFRNFIDKTWQTIQKIWDDILNFVKKIPEYITQAWDWVKQKTDEIWDAVYEKVSNVIGGIIDFFAKLPGRMGQILSQVGSALRDAFVNALVSLITFFRNLPGLIGNALGAAVRAVIGFVKRLPFFFGYAIGFVIGLWLRMWKILIQTAVRIVRGIFTVIGKLPGILADIFGAALDFVVDWGGKLIDFIIQTFTTIVTTIFNFLMQLPGMIFNILTTLATTFFNWGVQLVQWAFNTFLQFIQTIFSFLLQLPSMVWNFLTQALNFAINFIPQFASTALSIGKSILDGIWNFIKDLPSLVWDILNDVIGAFKDLVSKAFNAAKDFAKGLWEGFKDGLGINSPSYIEEALFAIQRTSSAAATDLRGSLQTMQGLSRTIPSINSGVLGLPTPAQAALTSNGGGAIYNQNAPLIGQATIRDERDAVTLSRMLAAEQAKQARAKGRS